jgi:hypothetical protein
VIRISFFVRTALEAGAEIVGAVRRDLRTEQIERHRVPEVQVPLQQVEGDDAFRSRIFTLAKDFRGTLRAPRHARL